MTQETPRCQYAIFNHGSFRKIERHGGKNVRGEGGKLGTKMKRQLWKKEENKQEKEEDKIYINLYLVSVICLCNLNVKIKKG